MVKMKRNIFFICRSSSQVDHENTKKLSRMNIHNMELSTVKKIIYRMSEKILKIIAYKWSTCTKNLLRNSAIEYVAASHTKGRSLRGQQFIKKSPNKKIRLKIVDSGLRKKLIV